MSGINFNCGNEKEIPWDAWYAPEINLRHDSLTYEYVWRMMDEIKGKHIPQPKPTKQLQIDGNTAMMVPGETRRFSVKNTDKTAQLNWTTSNDQIRIVAGQGTDTITVKYLGGINTICTIACVGEGNCYNYATPAFALQSFDKASTAEVAQTAQKTDCLTVNIPATAATKKYELVDVQGRVIANKTTTAQSGQISFDQVIAKAATVYVLRSTDANNNIAENKVVVR